MRKKLFIATIALSVLFSTFLVAGFLLPSTYDVQRSIVINKAVPTIFEEVYYTVNRKKWSPWQATDPNMKIRYAGPEYGVGSQLEWESENTWKW